MVWQTRISNSPPELKIKHHPPSPPPPIPASISKPVPQQQQQKKNEIPTMKPKKMIEIDGRVGEGGGQVVRIACALAAVTSQPIRITHIRANRGKDSLGGRSGGGRGGRDNKPKRKPGAEGYNKGYGTTTGAKKGTGLKSQHLSSIAFLAQATRARVEGLEIGSQCLEFVPSILPPSSFSPSFSSEEATTKKTPLLVDPPTHASSIPLIFQALLPFLLFSSSCAKRGTEIVVRGGTNVSFSPSWEYMDQVLLPELEGRFERVKIERELVKRGWALGPSSGKGEGRFRVWGVGALIPRVNDIVGEDDDGGETRKEAGEGRRRRRVSKINATILTPKELHEPLKEALARELGVLFPPSASASASKDGETSLPLEFVSVQESYHPSRMYVLLVAVRTTTTKTTGSEEKQEHHHQRWGHDYLFDEKYKGKKPEDLARLIARRVSKGLREEVGQTAEEEEDDDRMNTTVDQHLQDQLVVFQALARGRTEVRLASGGGGKKAEEEEEEEEEGEGEVLRKGVEGLELDEGVATTTTTTTTTTRLKQDKKTYESFGEGTLHTSTARWVASELLPTVKWFNNGTICEGAGVSFAAGEESTSENNP